MRGVFRFGGIAQEPEGQIIHGTAMFAVQFRELGRNQRNLRFVRTLTFCQRFVQNSTHH